MSSDTSATGGAITGPELEAILRENEALLAALRSARRTRLVVFLVLVAFVIIVCWAFYSLGNQRLSEENQDRVLQAMQKRLSDKQDSYLRQVQLLVENTSPKLTQAFYDQSVKDLPTYLKGVEKERDKLAQNLQVKLEQELDDHYNKLLQRHEKLFREAFPSITDEKVHQQMVANTQVAVKRLMKKYYLDEMNSQIKTLYETWDNFPLANSPGKDELPLEEQFKAYLYELVKYRLSHGNEVVKR
jgi:hypothetical protein